MKAGPFISVLLLSTVFGAAQNSRGQDEASLNRKVTMLNGRVFDRNGSVVVGSEVLLVGDKGSTFGAVTNDEGIYKVSLPAGFYNLQIRANGFSNYRLECYQIPSANAVNLDVTLKVSGEAGCESGVERPIPRGKKRKTIIIE